MISFMSGLFIFLGAFFFLISAIGVNKFPDTFSRMHSASKASSLGMGLCLIGTVLYFSSWIILMKSILIIFFIFLTAPVAAHILGRAAYITGARKSEKTIIDELEGTYIQENETQD